ncbi:hypothetical protein [Dactylosporangium sp. NPDC000521]|uniref:hypothetical protein n=1 Tax=Dactylosporangium sp. NPDC000521 TaxID=3363975 RepID=UPI0036BDCB79
MDTLTAILTPSADVVSGEPTTDTPADDQPEPQRTLGDVLADAGTAAFPAVRLTGSGAEGIVMGRTTMTAEIAFAGITRTETLDQPAVAVTDPARQAGLLRSALGAIAERSRLDQHRLGHERREHGRVLAEIRAYAIERHRGDDICRDGLDKFLAEFNLAPYEPTFRVRFTITGSYLVRGDSERDIIRDGSYAGIDLSRVDDVVEDSEDFDVTIDGADEISDDD